MEKTIYDTICLFAGEIHRLNTKLEGSEPSFDLTVSGPGRYSSDQTTLRITLSVRFYDGSNEYRTVTAASLDALMSEVYRLAGFAAKQQAAKERLEQSLMALPAPQD